MINFKSSILYSITFAFLLSIISVILAFLFLIKYDKEKYTAELNAKYSIIATTTLRYVRNMASAQQMEEIVKNYQMEEVVEEPLKSYILKNGEILEYIQSDIGNAAIIAYKKDNYLSIIPARYDAMLLKDQEYKPYKYDVMNMICTFVLLIILAAYIFTIRKIRPLKKLKQQIDKFAMGDFDAPKPYSGTDEISEVANAFYTSVNHIKKLNHSRQLFLRNIMHELKTPITKGRITAEMLQENEKKKQRIIAAFERLEATINEFASIERITSGIELTNIGTYRLIDIFDEAIDLAMIERDNIYFHISKDLHLNVDFKLFSLAVKNMVDNAIKYSSDKSVTIIVDDDSIKFVSSGEPLDKAFEYYLTPFAQGNNKTKGLGLGLYIVDNIIKAHKINFTYKHKNGENIFSFENLKALR
ncbi:MAG: ArsS family sensor histidine kinase [Campylobacteraceae bacterium]|jgi:two-component system OmpR family sensor kinase|nr:ArsS family sensor histidine kinase [Campylobacteraceae bacterium]